MSLPGRQKKLLLSYQINNSENIMRILKGNGSVLDSSDTGTGKTYTALAACSAMGLDPIIICPKVVIASWLRVCDIFKIKPFFIVNYETIKNLKYYDKNRNRIICPYIKYDAKNKEYTWIDLPKNVVFIFDEAHRCSSMGSYNGLLLLGTRRSTENYIMLLSATIADHPEKFKPFFYILNFISREQVKESNIDFKKYMKIMDSWIFRDPRPMVRIHNMLFPDRGTRMSISALGKLFPETQINAVPYTMGKKVENEIEAAYEEISDGLEDLKNKLKKDKNPLVRLLRAHQKIELLKIPTIVELANDFLNDGLSVVIFVNFTQTLKTIAKMLSTDCLIYGEQTDNERQTNIDMFQQDTEHIIICNIKAGGVGLSLHDINGNRRRVSLISPCWSAIDLTQALGRVHRAGGKSKSLQRIIYCASTVEERIAEKIQIKLKDLGSVNDGDLDLSNITFDKKPTDATGAK